MASRKDLQAVLAGGRTRFAGGGRFVTFGVTVVLSAFLTAALGFLLAALLRLLAAPSFLFSLRGKCALLLDHGCSGLLDLLLPQTPVLLLLPRLLLLLLISGALLLLLSSLRRSGVRNFTLSRLLLFPFQDAVSTHVADGEGVNQRDADAFVTKGGARRFEVG